MGRGHFQRIEVAQKSVIPSTTMPRFPTAVQYCLLLFARRNGCYSVLETAIPCGHTIFQLRMSACAPDMQGLRNCSECPVPTLNDKMHVVQHLLLGAHILTPVIHPLSLIEPPANQQDGSYILDFCDQTEVAKVASSLACLPRCNGHANARTDGWRNEKVGLGSSLDA
ncbi:hypothetical protein OAN307_c37680 [Octadecabacter antarcticus 307]|uniref:Uncharacterized protein n=1 Tax=Octadecabacter antarcticus 307 TaxID=391626 RepID=M9RAJ8_9RHOB|nr:hypothetical protein OAN307_c37680 [Octadecabacter antarcticus 307]